MQKIQTKNVLKPSEIRKGNLLILGIGIFLFIWQLGSTGLIDETPPLFAAAARSMHETGDWLTPRVNGLPRFDKPPLIYWFMALIYSVPGGSIWDPLGTWSARLPSAISTIFLMLALGDTVMRFVQCNDQFPRRSGFIASLSFALSPLVIIWGRIAVSDALLCSTFGLSMLFHWRRFANPYKQPWYISWLFLGLSVLVKGPIALVLSAISLSLFVSFSGNYSLFMERLKPLKGFFIVLFISFPWYFLELLFEGKRYWESFFGYHNFQRFTSVVNSHQEPWWFFFLMLFIASLPFTPFLIVALIRTTKRVITRSISSLEPDQTLMLFAYCWLFSVFIFFTMSATKLPSYWLPATPAAGLLIALTANSLKPNRLESSFAWGMSVFLCLLLAIIFWFSYLWAPLISDPEMPSLGTEIISSGITTKAAICFSLVSITGLFMFFTDNRLGFILMQSQLILFPIFVLFPAWNLTDKLRQKPIREAAALMVEIGSDYENLAMVGIVKPSLHFYSNRIIFYEDRTSIGLVNLAERLNQENRKGLLGKKSDRPNGSATVLVLIDDLTANRSYWKGLNHEKLGKFSIYNVWRINRVDLEKRANHLIDRGITPDWKLPRHERL